MDLAVMPESLKFNYQKNVSLLSFSGIHLRMSQTTDDLWLKWQTKLKRGCFLAVIANKKLYFIDCRDLRILPQLKIRR